MANNQAVVELEDEELLREDLEEGMFGADSWTDIKGME